MDRACVRTADHGGGGGLVWQREGKTQNGAVGVHSPNQLPHLTGSLCDTASFVSIKKCDILVVCTYMHAVAHPVEIFASLACSHSIHESQKWEAGKYPLTDQ